MFVVKQLGPESFSVSAPLDGFEVVAPTAREAADQLRAVLMIKSISTGRIAKLRRLTKIEFDPRQGWYVADCAAAGLSVTGFTRQDAFDNLMKAITLVEKARAAAMVEAQQGHEQGEADPIAEPETENLSG
jgi:hypothetical protein